MREQFIDREALELLERAEHWKELIEGIAEPVVSAQKVREKLVRHESKLGNIKEESVVIRGAFRGNAKECDPDFRVMKENDVTGQESSEGKLKDFLEYFMDKYTFLHSLLSKRQGFHPKPLDKLPGMQKYAEVDIIGMVVRRWVSKNGNMTIELDAPEGRCIAIVSKEDKECNREAEKILLDDVIGIKGKKFSEEVIIAKSFIWPDMMQRQPRTAERDLSVALISDVHVGSKLFMEKEFTKFISWLNGDIEGEKEAERAGKIKYLVIAGDNVDGIGVYPEQFDELEIKDVYGQYDKFSSLIKQVPEHIEVFICPGQHDAVRRADPQPAIPKEFVKELYGCSNIHFVGSPSWVEMEGMKCLIYHGASLHDMFATIKYLDYGEPQKAMAELLRKRDLSTGFGVKQPYVPEKRDFMVIREEPDFYFAGDIHHSGYMQYRGCYCLNAGCWQLRTEYQEREGHKPTPGIMLDVNLKTRKLTENNFAAVNY